MSVQTVFQSAITGRPPCIKLSFYFCAEAETRPISVSVRARFMGETSSSRSSSQLSTWFMATWAISRPAPQSSPSDELVPSARVTAVCFLRRTIFIHANKLNLPCFCGSYFLPPPNSRSYFPTYDLLRDNYQRREIDTDEKASQNSLRRLFFSPSEAPIWVITGFLMEVRCRNI